MHTPEKKILMVDNEPELTDLLKDALETAGGFQVRTENNPSLALSVAKEFAPDLIIMDIKMPELDGAGVVIQLKDEPALSETPIVFLTGTVTAPQIVTHGSKLGGLRFLPKTMRIEAMIACLQEILRHGAHPAAETRAA